MECTKLLSSLGIIGYGGTFMGFEKLQLLQYSLILLQADNHFKKCYYWGKINGVENDYYLAYGCQEDCLNQKFYYSTDCLYWYHLPKSAESSRFLAALSVDQFVGNSRVLVNVVEKNPPFPQDVDIKKFYKDMISNLKEEERLAATVESINLDAAIVPRGALYKCTSGNIVQNPCFEGLHKEECTVLSSYLHSRLLYEKQKKNLSRRQDYDHAIDFLDPITCDVPKNCWSLKILHQGFVILKSLNWPGMVFYHEIDTPNYGYHYIGDGKKNMNIPFML